MICEYLKKSEPIHWFMSFVQLTLANRMMKIAEEFKTSAIFLCATYVTSSIFTIFLYICKKALDKLLIICYNVFIEHNTKEVLFYENHKEHQ